MEKLLLVQVGASKERQIRRLAEGKKIRVLSVGNDCGSDVLEALLSGERSSSQKERVALPAAELVVFSDVTDKHFEKLLFEMRTKGIQVDYKAVATPVNRNWTMETLYRELEREKEQLMRAGNEEV